MQKSASKFTSSSEQLLDALRLLHNCGVTQEMIVNGISMVQGGLSQPLEVFDNLESMIRPDSYKNREEKRRIERALKFILKQTTDVYLRAIELLDNPDARTEPPELITPPEPASSSLSEERASPQRAAELLGPPELITPPELASSTLSVSSSFSEDRASLQRAVHRLKDSGITQKMILDGIESVQIGKIPVCRVSESIEKSILDSAYNGRDEKRVIIRALKLALRQRNDEYLNAVEFLKHNEAPKEPEILPTRAVHSINTGRGEMTKRLWGNEIGRGYLYGGAGASLEIKEAMWLPKSSNGRETQRNGLFALKTFKKNEKITPYAGDGKYVTHDIFKFPALTSHFKTLQKLQDIYYVIDGFREPRVGFGLGQFANDKRDKSAVNARIETIDVEDTGSLSFNQMGAFLVAKKDIAAGDEILIDYGSTYWKTAEQQYDSRKRK